jgi:hypothetical protein
MAKALQCPGCGYKHRLDGLGPLGRTIQCEQCGKLLRVPDAFRAPTPVSVPDAPKPTSTPAGGVDPTVLDLDSSVVMAAVSRESSAVPPAAPRISSSTGAARPAPKATASVLAPTGAPSWFDKVVVRFVIWIAALTVAAYLTFRIGRVAGFLDKQSSLQIVNGDTVWSRYSHIGVLVLLWAFLTATIVHLVIEVGRRLERRRDAIRDER